MAAAFARSEESSSSKIMEAGDPHSTRSLRSLAQGRLSPHRRKREASG
jgi:hypothetical protein